MPYRAERSAGVMLGDIAAGDGMIGIVADLPGGTVGIAPFGPYGEPRRIAYIPCENCHLVLRSWECRQTTVEQRQMIERLGSRGEREIDRSL